MALLGDLRLIERDAFGAEIGAGVLPVGIEEEIEELGRQVVVMGDVLAIAVDRQELAQLGRRIAG
ncbi:hypothetical protein D3C72_2304120 [compost metagenome]